MFNQVFLVGRIAEDVDIKNCNITISITRSYKNETGVYDIDYVNVAINKIKSQNFKMNDIILVKGCIQSEYIDNVRKVYILAEKISFLSNDRRI